MGVGKGLASILPTGTPLESVFPSSPTAASEDKAEQHCVAVPEKQEQPLAWARPLSRVPVAASEKHHSQGLMAAVNR